MWLSDLFGRQRTLLPKGKILDERAELISYFTSELGKESKVIGIRLAHYSLSDLYALKSAYNDRLHRNGKEAAQKYFYWVSKTTTQ